MSKMKSIYHDLLIGFWAMGALDGLALGSFDGDSSVYFDDSFGTTGDYEA